MTTNNQKNDNFLIRFLKADAAGGILLLVVTVVAIVLANTPLESYYSLLIDTPVQVSIGDLVIAKPLLLWINDGLMAVFFFLIGLELKRELLEGELSDPKNIILPGLGAIGGMAGPALVYVFFNYGDEVAMRGWAIPAATDIAFALGILMLFGSRVHISLKIFLTSLAIFDDIGAILIIAFFYTDSISVIALYFASACVVALFFVNRLGITSRGIYISIGLVMWVALLKSGVHATLAGVLLAMFIPNKPCHANTAGDGHTLLKDMEHELHITVAFIILPIFAFANAGLNLHGVTTEQLLHGVPLGIVLGLFVGKQVGIFGICWVAIKAGIVNMPDGMNWALLYGLSALCGVGFTMSLFIGSLAFEETGVNLLFDERLGILLGSLISGIVGYFVLRAALPADESEAAQKASNK